MHKRGFTLIELLTVVLVVAVLVAMATPMYEKAIEKSHMAEARNMLKIILESKLRTLQTMKVDHYGFTTEEYLDVPEPDCKIIMGKEVCIEGLPTLRTKKHYTFAMHALDASVCCTADGNNYRGRDYELAGKNSCLRCAGDDRNVSDWEHKQDGYTKSFFYSLYPQGSHLPAGVAEHLAPGYGDESTALKDAVCAKRIGVGDLAGVNFLYVGSIVTEGPKLFCYDPKGPVSGKDRCEQYGMKSVTGGYAWCGEGTTP